MAMRAKMRSRCAQTGVLVMTPMVRLVIVAWQTYAALAGRGPCGAASWRQRLHAVVTQLGASLSALEKLQPTQ